MLSALSSASEPHPLGGAAAQPSRPPRHPGRCEGAEQSEPTPNPTGSLTQARRVKALVGRLGTGRAATVLKWEITPWMFAPSREAALERQRDYIEGYLHPKPRATARKPSAPADAVQPRPQRAAAPRDLAEPSRPRGPQPGHGRPGPGRGHIYEPTRPIEEQLDPGPEPTQGENWLQRLAREKKWKTDRIAELERQV